MVAALWLLVISVVGADPADPMAASLEATLRQALADVAEVVVAPVPDGVSPPGARPAVHLVVTLTRATSSELGGTELTTATLALVAEGGAELTRQVVFTETDTPGERGRTLAFVALSMLPDVSLADVVTTTPQAPRAGEPHAPGSPAGALAQPPRELVAPPVGEGRVGLELRGVAAVGLADEGATTSFGGALGVVWAPWSRVGFRADICARAGDLDVAQATSLWLAATVGASFVVLRARGAVDLDLELWLGGGVGRQSLNHLGVGDLVTDAQSAWSFVGRAGLALAWVLRPGFAVLADVGADFFALKLPVFVADRLSATLEPVRPTVGVGLRVSL